MAKADTLDRVAADLAGGRTQPAIQRLSSLVAAHPTDLDLRRRLAAVHRMTGNSIEAGRWNYLSPDADPAELAAFERAYQDPHVRLRRLHWPVPAAHAPTGYARDRLASLIALAGDGALTAKRATTEVLPTARLGIPRIGRAFWVAFAVAVAFAAIGAVTIVQWLVR